MSERKWNVPGYKVQNLAMELHEKFGDDVVSLIERIIDETLRREAAPEIADAGRERLNILAMSIGARWHDTQGWRLPFFRHNQDDEYMPFKEWIAARREAAARLEAEITDAEVERAAKAMFGKHHPGCLWDGQSIPEKDHWRGLAVAALAVARGGDE